MPSATRSLVMVMRKHLFQHRHCRLLLVVVLLVLLCSFYVPWRLWHGASAASPAAVECSASNDAAEESSDVIVRVNAYKRHRRAYEAALHYARCAVVRHVDVVWSDPDAAPPEYFHNACPRKISVTQFTSPSLNNRFVPLDERKLAINGAVFSVDDDVLVNCHSLALAKETFDHAPRGTLVGFDARAHVRSTANDQKKSSHGIKRPYSTSKWLYRKWWTVTSQGWYSIVLTKAAFMSHEMLHLYTYTAPRLALAEVDARRNCEDILMQFVASNATGQPPLLVFGSYTDSGAFGGISTASSAHADERSHCIDLFEHAFGTMPLQHSSRFVQPVSRSWLKAPTVLELFAIP